MEEIFSTSLSKSVKLFVDSDDKTDPVTIIQAFDEIVANYGDRIALMQKNQADNEWKGISYKVYREKVVKMAKVFIKLGLEEHGTVVILGDNCVEWFIAELAAIYAGGIFTGIYTTNSVEACRHILENSAAQIVVVDDQDQLKKICAAIEGLKTVKAVIQISPPFDDKIMKENKFWRWSELELLNTKDTSIEYEKRQSKIAPNQCCGILYTSGTTGNSKGAMISHDNFIYDFKISAKNLKISPETQECFISYLPLCHLAGQFNVFLPMTVAGTVYFAGKNAMKSSFLETLKEVRPTFFLGVPRIFEKIQAKVLQLETQNSFLWNALENTCKSVCFRYNINRQSRNGNFLLMEISRQLCINQKKKELGLDRCRNVYTAAAPMSLELKHYFLSLDIIVKNTYGMTEILVLTFAEADADLDSIGRPLDGIKCKISNPDSSGDGEIVVQGRNVFMGYLNNAEKTLEVIDSDRWFHTGDLGRIDDTGCVYITGRLKEIIITKGGENIPPVHIENLVKAECDAISNAFLVGDNRKFLNILITLKTVSDANGLLTDDLATETLKWLESMGLNYTKLPEILASGPHPKVLQSIQDAVDRANMKAISRAQRVQKFAILPKDFSFATGELGPTLKLKRNVVAEKYKNLIDDFYEN